MRRHLVRRSLLFFSLTILLAGIRPLHAQSAPPSGPDPFDLNAIDSSLDPCVAFYEYACKKWKAANPIPSDQARWSHGGKLHLWNQGVLRDVLEKASANDTSRTPVQQKIGDYYASCSNESEINAKGIAAIQPELD